MKIRGPGEVDQTKQSGWPEFKVASPLDFKLIEKEFSLKELYQSDEVFITSSGSLVTPITQIDSIKINNKKIGKITKSLALSFYKSII